MPKSTNAAPKLSSDTATIPAATSHNPVVASISVIKLKRNGRPDAVRPLCEVISENLRSDQDRLPDIFII
jgi:hypothetical protein